MAIDVSLYLNIQQKNASDEAFLIILKRINYSFIYPNS
jgi:hypothetical protein